MYLNLLKLKVRRTYAMGNDNIVNHALAISNENF
jgi:hypothetical protein